MPVFKSIRPGVYKGILFVPEEDSPMGVAVVGNEVRVKMLRESGFYGKQVFELGKHDREISEIMPSVSKEDEERRTLTIHDLRARARELEIKGYMKMTKEELVRAIAAAERGVE